MEAVRDALYTDGITGLRGAFSREWTQRMREDIEAAFADAITRPGGAARPVLVLGVDAPGAGHANLHDQLVTRDEYAALPALVRDHFVCRVVDKIEPIVQKHTIEGLLIAAP